MGRGKGNVEYFIVEYEKKERIEKNKEGERKRKMGRENILPRWPTTKNGIIPAKHPKIANFTRRT